jgi:tRNA G18 (ribose-2'-O)-methylase SpoU
MNNLAVAVMNLMNESNVGGLVRTANAAALREVVIVGRKKWNKGAATRAHSKIKVVKMRTSDEFVDYCKKNNYNIVSVEIGGDSNNIFEYEYPENTMLVIGNEGTGVPQKILDNSVSRVYIPQYGGVECLNAAIAGSIAIYDWIRKNNSCVELNTTERKFSTESLGSYKH